MPIGQSQVGKGGSRFTIQRTGLPLATDNAINIVLPAEIQGEASGIFRGHECLIRTYWSVGATEGFNIFIGDAGNFTFIGAPATLEGSHNIGIGKVALATLTAGEYNIGIGVRALMANTDGSWNIAIGVSALDANIGGDSNIAIGWEAVSANTTGSGNVGIGENALRRNITGNTNVAVGDEAMQVNTAGDNNTGVGCWVLGLCTGSRNTAFGREALYSVVAASGNVAIGYNAGFFETGSNKLFIDNTSRTNEADARIKALVYGIFDAATASQHFTVNGHLGQLLSEIPIAVNNAAAAVAGCLVGEFYRSNADPSIVYVRTA